MQWQFVQVCTYLQPQEIIKLSEDQPTPTPNFMSWNIYIECHCNHPNASTHRSLSLLWAHSSQEDTLRACVQNTTFSLKILVLL